MEEEINMDSFIKRSNSWQHVTTSELKIEKRNDYYASVLGHSIKNGTIYKIELFLTPDNKELFSIKYRKKSIKGLKHVYNIKIENLKKDLNVILDTRESCLSLINFLTATKTISKFNL